MVRDASSAAVTTMSKEAKKVGVIGAGIIGIVVASCLQRGGHEVFVVDPNEPGKGRSVRSIAADLGVDESTVRYRPRRRREHASDGRREKTEVCGAFSDVIAVWIAGRRRR
jgi:glycine/D-amino acid oxidase-like deaminating enzyme